MKLYEAKNIITDVFEKPFEKEKFSYFIRNLLKNLHPAEFLRTGYNIPKAFEDFITSYERLGKFEDEEGNLIDVLIIKLKRDHSIDYARSTQRNFVRWYLNEKGKDAALVAFHSEKSLEWRFSFVKMQYSLEKKKDELTPAKRSSFMVGESGKSHTAQRQLIDLLINDHAPCLSDIENAFSIEAVSDEFYEKYKTLLFNLVDGIENIVEKDKKLKEEFESKNISILNFSKKLLGQIVFLYFLQKKGWLGLEEKDKYGEGDKHFMRSLFNKSKPGENFFNDYLEYLFYDALSKKRVTDYYERFKTRIPFLNGGLFDPIEFYDWQKTDIDIPNHLFSDRKGDEEGSGILDVFDLYNFTVKEDEPLETEVAIDPEMLGKVFERMLDVTERKSKGAFYTPREIVHYMAQQSLLYYLVSQASSLRISKHDDWKAELETFIHYGEHIIDKDIAIEEGKLSQTANKQAIPESIRQHADAIDKALENIKICDPAVGSGAFPVGIMNEIVKLRKLLTPFIVPQASSLRRHNDSQTGSLTHNDSQTGSLRNIQEDFVIMYFDKNAETEIYERDLPHWCQKGVAYFVTFRLADSIPDSAKEKINRERENWLKKYKIKHSFEIKKLPKPAQFEFYKLFSKRYDELLDNAYGSCILAKPGIKELVEKALKHFDGERYILDEFVVMPNHVHVIVIPKKDWTLDKITHSWKSFTANEINKITGNTGQVWMHESFDHIIRSEKQLHKIRQYIKDNPIVSQASSLRSSDDPQTGNLTHNDSQAGSLTHNDSQAGSLRHTERSAYRFKSNAIQNSIYGVDIDAGAVEIAKLRLWLSMIVDEERINNIEPLPNLEYKIVCGNSLINMPDGSIRNGDLETEIETLAKNYYTISDKQKKQEQKEIIDGKIQQLLASASEFAGYEIDFDFKLFFREVWNEKDGFDVVIGNPPFIDSESMVKQNLSEQRRIIGDSYRFTKGNWDIYIAFFDKSFSVLNSNANLIFISPDKWLSKPFGYELRKGIYEYLISILEAGRKVFKAAKVDSIVTHINRKKRDSFVIRNYVNNQICDIKVFQNRILKTPFKFDWLFSEFIETIIKIEMLDSRFNDFFSCESACATSDAYKLKDFIIANNSKDFNEDEFLKIINTGTIGKYVDKWGKKPMTYLGNKYLFPIIKKDIFSANFNNSYGEKSIKRKIIIKGLTLLDACIDFKGNTIPGKSTLMISSNNLEYLKFILALVNSKTVFFYIKEKNRGSSYNQGINFSKEMINELPFPNFSKIAIDPFIKIIDFLLFLKIQDIENLSFYFEQLIDGMVYELYFENEIKQAGCDILKSLNDLPEIKDEMEDEEKMKIITKVFNKLYDKESPVRKNLEAMNRVEEVAIIEKSLEK